MMIKAATFNFLDVTRRHSRKYSRSSGSTPGATLPFAAEFWRFPADPHQPEPGVRAAAAVVLAGNSYSTPALGCGPRVNVIEDPAAAVADAAARSVAVRLARRFDRGAATGSRSQPIS